MFTEALFTIARSWKQPKCPSTDEWIKKMWYIHTMKYYSPIKEGNNVICSNMDATRDYHTKWSQTEKDKYHTTSLYVELKIDTNETIYKTETYSQTQRTDWWLPRGRGLGEGWSGRWGWADANYYIEDGYTTGSYCRAQGTIFNIRKRIWKRMYIYV